MKHYNPSIAEDVNRIFNPKGEFLSPIILDEIRAVIPIERVQTTVIDCSSAAVGTTVNTALDSNRDFYATGFSHGFACSAAFDGSGYHLLRGVVNGKNVDISRIPIITLTATHAVVAMSFEKPFKFDRGSNITSGYSVAGTVGTVYREARVFGYYVDTTK